MLHVTWLAFIMIENVIGSHKDDCSTVIKQLCLTMFLTCFISYLM